VLIRLAGCNLACSWCDTAGRFSFGEDYAVKDLLEIVKESLRPWALITGGEPLLRVETVALARGLVGENVAVLVETNGTMDISVLPPEVVKSVDCKTPSSGHAGSFRESNREFLSPRDAVKFVIADRRDFDWAIAEAGRLDFWPRAQVIFSPAGGHIKGAELARWILDERYPIRLSAQLHKVWDIP